MTAEELSQLEEENGRHELVKGKLLTLPFLSVEHGSILATAMAILGQHIKSNNLGVALARSGFKLESDPDTVLGPNMSFISRERVGIVTDDYYSGPPDLAVELISSTTEGRAKADQWLSFGTQSVWLIDSRMRTVEVFHADGKRWLFQEHDELVDNTVPGFRVAVSEIFS